MLVDDTSHSIIGLPGDRIADTIFIGLGMSSYISSMAVNLAGTGLIAYILWNNVRFLRRLGQLEHQFNVWRILLLLVESGAIYAVVQMVYPALTIAIISGPFSMDRVQESVVEVQTLSAANQSV
ncbi:hypothetical protein H0H93_002985 [Arthromyces matolae]|nr:hypothetical protein H0H93_002985 [Arthromyces matolae]